MQIMKKLFIFFLLFSIAFNITIIAYSTNDEITAPSALLMESQTGKVLYEKNPHEKRSCASITKIMTVLLIMEAIDNGKIEINETITASNHAASMGGSDIWLKPGENMTVDEMLKATMVASANDTAVALAEHLSGSEEAFVREMNQRATELGMKETCFKNCNGLDEDGHFSTAYDVALMSRELTKHPQIFAYTSIWIDYLREGKTQLVNTNKLLKGYKGITGLKTGTTGQAKCCVSATATRDGLSLISVILGSEDSKTRFRDASKLLDLGFANYAMVNPTLPSESIRNVKVINGMKNSVSVNPEISGNLLITKGREKEIKSTIDLQEEIEAPVYKGQTLGKIIYKLNNDEILSEYNILAEDDIPTMSFSSVFSLIFKNLLKT